MTGALSIEATAIDPVRIVETLNDRYARVLDDAQYERWPELFTEPCLYKILPRESVEQGLLASLLFFDNQAMLRDRVLCVREVSIYSPHSTRHFLGRPFAELRDDGAIAARTNVMVVHSDGSGRASIFAVGEYQDIIVRQGDDWLFCEKVIVLDSFMVPSHLAEPL